MLMEMKVFPSPAMEDVTIITLHPGLSLSNIKVKLVRIIRNASAMCVRAFFVATMVLPASSPFGTSPIAGILNLIKS